MINYDKLMSLKERLKELGEAMLKSPPDTETMIVIGEELMLDWFSFIDNIGLMVQKFGFKPDEAMAVTGLTKKQYYNRLENPSLWKREELEKLWKAAKKKRKSSGK